MALRVAASAQAAWEALGIRIPVDGVLRDRWLEPLRQTLPYKQAREWWAEGRALPINKVVALAENELLQITSPQAIPAAAETTPNPLTPRQQQVAVLVAQGLTNRQIADRLVVTERAVAAHVEHILDKLGVGSRAQIAVWASERGLLTTRSV